MGRATEGVSSPVDLLLLYARFYSRKVRTGVTNQLYFFSKDKKECDSLVILGGNVYRQDGGWAWMCGKRKQLAAIYKLMLPYYDEETGIGDVKKFMNWAKGHLVDF